jgi:hypothetical protein
MPADRREPGAAHETAAKRSYEVVPFEEADGRITWAVREEVHAWPDYYRRQLVSFHVSRDTAQDARDACAR